jgi:hypothetical protein
MRALAMVTSLVVTGFMLNGCRPDTAFTPPSLSTATAFSVNIGGPSTAAPGESCEWWAIPSGGTPPYRYHWIVGAWEAPSSDYGNPPGFVEDYDVVVHSGGTTSFKVILQAYDAADTFAQKTRTVLVGGQNGACNR